MDADPMDAINAAWTFLKCLARSLDGVRVRPKAVLHDVDYH
jgi:hypothetical protein